MIRALAKMALLLALLTTVAYSAEMKFRFFADLFDDDLSVRMRAYEDALRDRDEKVRELISIVERKDLIASDGEQLIAAINLLGQYRAPEAVDPLTDRLMYLPAPKGRILELGRNPTQSYYPCARALARIGEPAGVVGAMIRKIEFSDQKEERELAAWVIMQIQGQEQALATLNAEAKKLGGKHQERVEDTAEYVRSFKQTFGRPHVKKIGEKREGLNSPAGALGR